MRYLNFLLCVGHQIFYILVRFRPASTLYFPTPDHRLKLLSVLMLLFPLQIYEVPPQCTSDQIPLSSKYTKYLYPIPQIRYKKYSTHKQGYKQTFTLSNSSYANS